MNNLKSSFFIAFLVMVGGCTSKVDQLSSMEKKGYSYARALSKEYEVMARQESDAFHQNMNTVQYADKGIQAASGLEVLPNDPEVMGHIHDAQDRKELVDARERLIFGLYKSGMVIDPENAARAVAYYDCWVEEASGGWCGCHRVPKEARKCKWQFYKTIIKMEENVREKAPTFMVWYNLHDAKIGRQGREEIDQVSKVLQHLRNHKLLIHCMGDPVGGRATNLNVSQKRATGLREALIKEGVPRDRIEDAVGLGEKGKSEVDPFYRRCDIHLR